MCNKDNKNTGSKIPYDWNENPNLKMSEEEIKQAKESSEYLTSCFVEENKINE